MQNEGFMKATKIFFSLWLKNLGFLPSLCTLKTVLRKGFEVVFERLCNLDFQVQNWILNGLLSLNRQFDFVEKLIHYQNF